MNGTEEVVEWVKKHFPQLTEMIRATDAKYFLAEVMRRVRYRPQLDMFPDSYAGYARACQFKQSDPSPDLNAYVRCAEHIIMGELSGEHFRYFLQARYWAKDEITPDMKLKATPDEINGYANIRTVAEWPRGLDDSWTTSTTGIMHPTLDDAKAEGPGLSMSELFKREEERRLKKIVEDERRKRKEEKDRREREKLARLRHIAKLEEERKKKEFIPVEGDDSFASW